MKIEEAKLGQTVYVKGIITDIDKDEIFDLEIHTPENDFFVNSEDVFLKLDQPKLVVPQFVADWYEEHKDKLEEELCYQIWLIRESGAETDFEYWLTETENAIQTLINMHQFGYTEKLYTVEIPNPNTLSTTALARSNVGDVVMCYQIDNYWKNNSRYQLTEAEIRKDFDWAWEQGFAKEVTE